MKKHFIFLIVFTILLAVFTVAVNAEGSEVSETVIEPVISVTADSVDDNILYEVQYDAILDQVCLKLTVDTLGVCIYDDPETSYIDGIRLNGETVNSLKIPIDVSKENKVVIRTVYKDDFTGVLAQITDGTYDYAKLLTNPVGLLMAGYYVLAALLTAISIIAALKGRSKKVKSSEEIASAVDSRADSASTKLKEEAIELFKPVFTKILQSQEAIVKSLVLTHSKDSNSHLEALESLKSISGLGVDGIIDKIQAEVMSNIRTEDTHKQHVIDDLTKIAETAQEESADGEIPIF